MSRECPQPWLVSAVLNLLDTPPGQHGGVYPPERFGYYDLLKPPDGPVSKPTSHLATLNVQAGASGCLKGSMRSLDPKGASASPASVLRCKIAGLKAQTESRSWSPAFWAWLRQRRGMLSKEQGCCERSNRAMLPVL